MAVSYSPTYADASANPEKGCSQVLRLEMERQRLGISKAELARRSDMNAATVTEACNGKRRPGLAQLDKLARGLDYRGEPCELLEEVADNASR